MNLPININDLLQAKTVESERIEYKEGWNPEAVLHTMTAFANDFNNQGGGYIIIGIKAEDGVPILPPTGLQQNQLDPFQRELLGLYHKMLPDYFPIVEVAEVQNKLILVIWCPGGQNRPYKCPIDLVKQNVRYAYYIRRYSNTVIANHDEEIELMQLAATVPFDDRINHRAKASDINLGLIRAYLQSVKSDLFDSSAKMDFADLLRRMNLVEGPPEQLYPKNVALMFFCPKPDSYFPYTQIDLAYFPEGEGADNFTEKIFKGPINIMLQEALDYLKASFITEKIMKIEGQAEAIRVFNYPFAAIEEALCNAIYHRSYEEREPVEIKILPDKIIISSFPGPDRSISDKDLSELRIIFRRYRNRRIGEFLKELHLTEGRGTGFPNIIRALKDNGSEQPKIYTDNDRTYFVIEFAIQKDYLKQLQEDKEKRAHDTAHDTAQVADQVSDQVLLLIKTLQSKPLSLPEIMKQMNLKHRTSFRETYIKPSLKLKLIEMSLPDKLQSKKQVYRLTELGIEVLEFIKDNNNG